MEISDADLIMNVNDAAARLEALGNPTRLQIYRLLVRAGHEGLTVGALQSKLDVAPSTLSHHLKSLMIVGLIMQERKATSLFCKANYPMMDGLVNFLVAECCADSACGAKVHAGPRTPEATSSSKKKA